jgi:hypothetical protein
MKGHSPECTAEVCVADCPTLRASVLSDSELERLAAQFDNQTVSEVLSFLGAAYEGLTEKEEGGILKRLFGRGKDEP